MKNTRIIIIDDEKNNHHLLQESLLQYFSDKVTIEGTATDISSAKRIISKNNPDLVLLNIQLPDGNCFDLLDELPEISFGIIFLTPHNDFIHKSLEFTSLKFLLKPVDHEKLISLIEQPWDKKTINAQKTQLEAAARTYRNLERKIILKTSDCVHVVSLENIIRCQADINYTIFHFKDQSQLIVSRTLKDFEIKLKDHGFFRAHKAHLINIRYIRSIDRKRLGYVMLTDGSKVPIAIRKRETLIRILESEYGFLY